ncbi:MAG: oxygen-independent coproporphyrinogen III oxidase [Sulfuriflexus sp.]|nr:oxygen-independent coproporphyrinogen III oxidase [Sulfuriflexus sp.]
MEQQLVFDTQLLTKYDVSGPRYTSYPTAPQFSEDFCEQNYRDSIAESNGDFLARPLSIYIHIPFCNTVCFYCGCNKVVTKDRSKGADYLIRLHKEIAMQAEMFDGDRIVKQIHLGGGTPTFINDPQLTVLMNELHKNFPIAEDDIGEYSIEIDPREANKETIIMLRDIGFNRLSLGVQDLDKSVQLAVNRVQSERETFDIIDAARASNFRSISLDLMYGLPNQSVDSFSRTLDRVIEAKPDRLSLFNYAHMPKLFKPQRRINEVDLPSPSVKMAILKQSIQQLEEAGYIYIGMDHFALPDDELSIAQSEGKLQRNFQGYSTHGDCDLLAMGVTAIGQTHNSFSQNHRNLDDYYAAIDAGHLPIFRGMTLTADDRLRARVIQELICHFRLDFNLISKQFDIDFNEYFSHELTKLLSMEKDGLLQVEANAIEVLPAGRLLIRNICMVFDAYLQKNQQQYSKVI